MDTKFRSSRPLTVGIELELQVVDPQTGQLSDRGSELVEEREELHSEITQAMVEYNSPVCDTPPQLFECLRAARDQIVRAAARRGLGICGGGLHPFHRWPDRQISEGERFRLVQERYGYLAQQFTVFGQHVHIGCRDGQEALYLCHALSRYVPHIIALAGSSPFYRGIDTGFDCARLNILAAFPTSGAAPLTMRWSTLERHLRKLKALRVIDSIKDLYWDVRPKPVTGTVEVRVCDTPLTITEAVDLAAYVQLLAADLLATRRVALRDDIYLPYRLNRFEACRFGFQGVVTDPETGRPEIIRTEFLRTLELLAPRARELDCTAAIERLRARTESGANGAARLRRVAADVAGLPEVVAWQSATWARDEASELAHAAA